MDDIVDLDVLVPQPAIIKFQGKEIQVEQPKTVDLLQMGFLLNQIMTDHGYTDDQLQKYIDQLTARMQKCIPELKGHDLNKAQLQRLVNMMTKLAMPEDMKQLEEKGISRADPKAPAGD
jgi:hypothetical protein